MTSVRKRLFIIAAVVALSLWAIYPPKEKIKLGLDLNGGVHLVLRVNTESALRLETQASVERLRRTLTDERIGFSSIVVTSPAEFRVDGVQNDDAFRRITASFDDSLERTGRDGSFTFRTRAGPGGRDSA